MSYFTFRDGNGFTPFENQIIIFESFQTVALVFIFIVALIICCVVCKSGGRVRPTRVGPPPPPEYQLLPEQESDLSRDDARTFLELVAGGDPDPSSILYTIRSQHPDLAEEFRILYPIHLLKLHDHERSAPASS